MKKAAAKEWIPNSEETDAELSEGVIKITDEKGNSQKFEISKGFCEVLKNEVSLLVQS